MPRPRGESGSDAVGLDFDRRLMLHFRGSLVLGLTEMAGDVLADARGGKNGRHALAGLFRQSVFGRLAGYEDVNDAERLRHDPAMRWIVGGKAAQEERGFAESDGALRDAMARGARELRCSCRPGWPVDRPCARPKATAWHRARHGFKREPDPRRAGDERLERPLRMHPLSPAFCVQPVWRSGTLLVAPRHGRAG